MTLTVEEAIKMQGTEFIYEFLNGDTMPAYIKKFDPKVGLSCWSFGFVTKQGHKFEPISAEEKAEGAVCLIGVNCKGDDLALNRALKYLSEIQRYGSYIKERHTYNFQGCPL